MGKGIIFISGFLAALTSWYIISTRIIPSLPSYLAISSYAPVAAKLKAIGEVVPASPSVYFVGGSNVFIGIDAEAFTEETGVPAYNLNP